jgi:hypothetical protein
MINQWQNNNFSVMFSTSPYSNYGLPEMQINYCFSRFCAAGCGYQGGEKELVLVLQPLICSREQDEYS